MTRVVLDDGLSFEAVRGETLLAAAQRAGLTPEYGCSTGRCGSCRVRVTEGQTRAIHAESGLNDEDQSRGWILSCVREAEGEHVSIEAMSRLDLRLPAPRVLPCRIHTIESLAEDVLSVVLRLPPTQLWTHRAGQYVDVIAPGGLQRSYSLASAAPAAGCTGAMLTLEIRRVPGGAMSQWWFEQARPGDLLRLKGPLGTCVLRDTADRHLVLLATGTGVAPMRAMLAELSDPAAGHGQPRSITLYWGARHSQDLYRHPQTPAALGCSVESVLVLSRPPQDWTGARGHVQDVLLAQSPRLEQALVYACGSESMIHEARRCLLAAGLAPERFHSDAFVASAPV
jgi:CDP-4-dehydro-6-deoxyglucose reductase, E3